MSVKTINLKFDSEEEKRIEVLYNTDTHVVATSPRSEVIEETVWEMLEDIGCWDWDYFKELLSQNSSFYGSILTY